MNALIRTFVTACFIQAVGLFILVLEMITKMDWPAAPESWGPWLGVTTFVSVSVGLATALNPNS